MSVHTLPLRMSQLPSPLHVSGRNCLLASLPQQEYELLAPHLERVSLGRAAVLFGRNQPITHAYFPLTAIASLVIALDDGGTVEVATVGNEGYAGVPLLLDADRSPTEAFTQIAGDYLRISASAFAAQMRTGGAFATAMRRYAQGFLTQISQSTACNRFHPIEQRLCRWILMTHDRVGEHHLALTQDFIAMMLGVRRASVAVAAGLLQKAGMIHYRRGDLEVVDRPQLEQSSCECYAVVRREYERLLC